jgi:hypothetical protein
VTDAYSAQYPMARFNPGQRVCLAWPSKNHVAAPCTNAYIPDTELKIYLSGANPTRDPTLAEFEQNLIADLGDHVNGVMDFKGFQRCPKFCENMDKSFCSRCFNIPSNLASGVYTMLWYWVFNPGSPAYTTCMDVIIGGAAVNTTGSATTASATTASATTASATTASATTASATTASATTASATTGTPGTTGTPVTTTGAAGTTTGTSSGQVYSIFDEALNSAWLTSWSWNAQISVDSTTAFAGTKSLKVVVQPWGGLQLGAASLGITWNGVYRYLNFAIKSEAPTTQLEVYFNGGRKVAAPSFTAWTPYQFSLGADLQAPAMIGNPNGLMFFNNGPQPVTLYLDAVTLS